VALVAVLLVWLLMGGIGFALYKARRTAMLAAVSGTTWRRSVVIGSFGGAAMVVAVVASSSRHEWSFAAICIGVYLVLWGAVWLAMRAVRRRSD
jgi:hypothetical protein